MNDALIGSTGFVGSTLARARPFRDAFNSKTIHQIDGRRYDTVYCAGASAVKWLANKEPETDIEAIRRLMRHLGMVSAERFVLFSTVDVYRAPVGVTEADEPDLEGLEPYGAHRLMLERFVVRRFPRSIVIRLPGLFGVGLRKNVIFDMLHRNQTDRISPNSVMQWYPMRRLADDVKRIEATDLCVLNVAVEPVQTKTIRDRFFPNVDIGGPELSGVRYDVRSEFAEMLGGAGSYHLSAEASMTELGRFLEVESSGQ